MDYKPVSHIIGEVVDAFRQEYTAEKEIPYYDYGTPLEVVNRLTKMANSDDYSEKRFPLVWNLIQDSVNENVNYTKSHFREPLDLTIIICAITTADYSTAERYTNIITPVLRPIYEGFMYYLKRNNDIYPTSNKFSHKYTENMFWGREGLYGHVGNIFNDRIDAVIISNLSFYVQNKC